MAIDLYIDVVSGELVRSSTNTTPAALPPLVQGDTLALRIYLLARTASYPAIAPFTVINNAGLTMQVTIGTKAAAANTFYATQLTWTADAQNQYFAASLSLNTTEITALLGSAQTASAWFEVKSLSGGLPTTVLEKQVTINAAVNKPGAALPVTPGQTALSAETANATFLTRNIAGQIVLTNAAAGKSVAIYVDENGQFHADPIT